MKKGVKRIAIGTMLAGAAGYVAGILTAPKSGAETRESIKDFRDSRVHEAEKQLKKLHTELNALLGEAADKSRIVAEHGRAAASKGRKLAADHKPTKGSVENAENEIVAHATRARQKAREILSAVHSGEVDDRDLDKAVTEAGKAIQSLKKYLRK